MPATGRGTTVRAQVDAPGCTGPAISTLFRQPPPSPRNGAGQPGPGNDAGWLAARGGPHGYRTDRRPSRTRRGSPRVPHLAEGALGSAIAARFTGRAPARILAGHGRTGLARPARRRRTRRLRVRIART